MAVLKIPQNASEVLAMRQAVITRFERRVEENWPAVYEDAKKDKSVSFRVSLIYLKGVVIGAASCGLVGGFAGAGAGFAISGNPIGAQRGACLGAAAGMGVGVKLGCNWARETVPIVIKVSREFELWKKEAVAKDIFRIFQHYIANHDCLKDFLCPISLDVTLTPMRAPDNRIYEKQYIERWLTEKQYDANGVEIPKRMPFSGDIFTVDDLVFDDLCAARILRVINRILINEFSRDIPELPALDHAVILNALEIASNTLRGTLHAVYDEEARRIARQARQQNLNPDVYAQIAKQQYMRSLEACDEEFAHQSGIALKPPSDPDYELKENDIEFLPLPSYDDVTKMENVNLD